MTDPTLDATPGAGDLEALDWSAPGPGGWALDRSHFPGGTTAIGQQLMVEAMPAGMERVFGEIGAPVRRVDAGFVNGFMYTRVRPLVGGDRAATRVPPATVLRVVANLHPAFRRRARTAAHTLEQSPSREVAADWASRMKPELVELNTALQAIDPDAATDDELDELLSMLLDHIGVTTELHFWLHGHDLGPIARFLHACDRWELPADRVVESLAGASPSTAEPTERLVRIREAVEAAGADPSTLDALRAVSPEVAELVDAHLARHGQILATGYDVTSLTLAELPEVFLESVKTATVPTPPDHRAVADELKRSIPDGQHDHFELLLDDARAVMDMRDDNGPLTFEWPMGLLRRALLAAGRRLHARGELSAPTLALDATVDEARHLLGGGSPGDAELARRAERRRLLATATPPPLVGVVEPEPPTDVLPAPLPELVEMLQTAFRHLGMDGAEHDDGWSGVGIGDQTCVGRARVVADADEAIDAVEPGDVLVVRATSPAFNLVLGVAGAVVTADGGAMSHAAVLARELGIPAVVGAHDALSIPDGAQVEVNAADGTVRVLDG